MELVISVFGLLAVFGLTALAGCLVLGEEQFRASRVGWYGAAGIAALSLSWYAVGRFGVPMEWLLLGGFGLTVWLAKWRKLRFARGRVNWVVWLVAAGAAAALASFVFFQRVPDFGGELVLQKYAGHDEIWHLAVMRFLERGIPPENPIALGETLRGYHYFNDLYWTAAAQATGLSLSVLLLWVAPLVLAWIFVLSVWEFFRTLFSNRAVALGAAWLVALGSGWAFAARWLYPQAGKLDSVFWLDQPVSYAINLQLLLSLALFPVIAWLVRDGKRWWSLALLVGALAGIKVYGAVVLVPALAVAAIFSWLRQRDRSLALGAVGAGGIVAAVLASSSSRLGFPFFWAPGWFIRSLYEGGDRLNYPTWEIHRQLFVQTSNWPRLIWHWLTGGLTFLVGNFGAKLLGVLGLTRLRKAESPDIFLAVVLIASVAAPMLFLQKGIVWNSIQFLHYAQLPLGYFLARFVEKRGRAGFVMLAIAVGLSVPTTVMAVTQNFLPENYIRFDRALVASVSQLPDIATGSRLIVGPSLTDTSLVPALSGLPVFWTDGAISEILGLPTESYREQVRRWTKTSGDCPPGSIIVNLPNAEEAALTGQYIGPVFLSVCPQL